MEQPMNSKHYDMYSRVKMEEFEPTLEKEGNLKRSSDTGEFLNQGLKKLTSKMEEARTSEHLSHKRVRVQIDWTKGKMAVVY